MPLPVSPLDSPPKTGRMLNRTLDSPRFFGGTNYPRAFFMIP